MGLADAEGGGGQFRPDRVAFTQHATEHRIQKSGGRYQAILLGRLDGFVDGGVRSDGVHAQQLIEPHIEKREQFRLWRALGQPFDEVLKHAFPAHTTVDELHDERPVRHLGRCHDPVRKITIFQPSTEHPGRGETGGMWGWF